MLASQIANVGESVIGAVLQDKKGYEWVSKKTCLFIYFLFFPCIWNIFFFFKFLQV